MSTHEPQPIEDEVNRLEQKHAELKERVETLRESRPHLTPDEELELARLKKERLWTKDALASVKRSEVS